MRTATPDLARSALDAAPDAMLIIDADGIIRYTNRQVSAVFGYEHDEIIGQSIEMLMPRAISCPACRASRELRQQCARTPHGRGPRAIRTAARRRRVSGRNQFEPDRRRGADPRGRRDPRCQDRKRIEAELIVAREAAEAARELADRANQGKSRFLATASHDLRQPLQTLELLNGTSAPACDRSDSIEALSQQEQAIGAMSRLLNALLDISKLESGAIRPEPTDFTVAAIFEELRLEFASIAANKGLQLEIEPCQDAVHSDPSLVEQILRNLVSNAVKYTREGCVRLRCLHEAALVRIEVLDTGVGIPADQLPYIYDEFYQIGVPANVSRDGYGLGLSIVQRLVKLLDAEARRSFRSGPRVRRSRCCSRRAAAEHDVPAHRLQARTSATHAIGEARVLVVEDNASVRRATCLLLELEGYHVTPVGSLSEALQHIQQGHGIDLLITDYHLATARPACRSSPRLRETLGNSCGRSHDRRYFLGNPAAAPRSPPAIHEQAGPRRRTAGAAAGAARHLNAGGGRNPGTTPAAILVQHMPVMRRDFHCFADCASIQTRAVQSGQGEGFMQLPSCCRQRVRSLSSVLCCSSAPRWRTQRTLTRTAS